VDTGLGPAGALVGAYLPTPVLLQPPVHLLENLQKAGVSPHYIDTVVLTHLHADHVGWNLEAEGSDRQLTFNRAPYLIHWADWDTFTRQAAHFSWVEQTVTPLQSLAALDLTSTDRSLTRDVTALHTPGPYARPHVRARRIRRATRHQWWRRDRSACLVTQRSWRFAADMDAQSARSTRHRILGRIEAENMTVAARHFPESGFGHGRVIRRRDAASGRRFRRSRIKLGFSVPVSGEWATLQNQIRIARHAEALGYHSLWVL